MPDTRPLTRLANALRKKYPRISVKASLTYFNGEPSHRTITFRGDPEQLIALGLTASFDYPGEVDDSGTRRLGGIDDRGAYVMHTCPVDGSVDAHDARRKALSKKTEAAARQIWIQIGSLARRE
jgi:hypothetical protein